jgi:hypothetical protein
MLAALAWTTGCASPGVPRPPSLQLPVPVKDLAAARSGGVVTLRFSLPQRTTDGVLLKSAMVSATFCRAVDTGVCKPTGAPPQSFSLAQATMGQVVDTLPPELSRGPQRLLTYRVQLANDRGRAAGYSEAAFSAAGSAPDPVAQLDVQGSRLGVVLTWQAAKDDGSKVILLREDLNAKPPAAKPASQAAPSHAAGTAAMKKPRPSHGAGPVAARRPHSETDNEPNIVWMDAGGESGSVSSLDEGALLDEPYRYSAERRRKVEIAGHALELSSELSASVPFTLHDVFPPPVPAGLSAAGFAGENLAYAVDLIWQPVEETRLAGYNVYRETLDTSGVATSPRTKLTSTPSALPAFHDTTAQTTARYRYSVTALDKRGNESEAATTVVEPNAP